MELEFREQTYYRVKRGQNLALIAAAFSLPPRLLAEENGLKAEVEEGQILHIPKESRNLYLVRGGESMTELCGSKENFEKRNRTTCLYPTQIVFL